MKRKSRFMLGALVVCLCLLLVIPLVSCGGDPKGNTRDSKSLIVGTTMSFESIDRTKADQAGEAGYRFDVLSASLSQLTPIYEDKGETKSLLCEIPVGTNGNTVWTFSLKPGYKWHDGTPVTNQDLMFTLSKQYGELKIGENLVENEGKVIATFAKKNNKVLSQMCTMRLYPKHIFDVEDKSTITEEKSVIGCGPFKFVGQDKNKGTLTFEKFNDYPEADKIFMNKVIVKTYGEEDVMVKELQNGNIDLMYNYQKGLSKAAIMQLSNSKNVTVQSFGSKRMPTNLFFNNNSDFGLKDRQQVLNVRKAIRKALDYEELANIFSTSNNAIGTEGFIPTKLYDENYGARESKKLQRNLEEAKALLTGAGFTTTNKLNLKLIVNTKNDEPRVQPKVVTMLEETGLISVNVKTSASLPAEYNTYDYDIAFTTITAGGFDMAAGYGTKYLLPNISSGWDGANPVCLCKYELEDEDGNATRFGTIFNALKSATTEEEKAAAIDSYQTFIEDESPVIALYMDSVSRGYSSDLSGFVISGAYDIFNVKSFETLQRK